MNFTHLGTDQAEGTLDGAVLDVRRIRVPAGEDVGVVGIADDLGEMVELRGDVAVHFDSDLDPEVAGIGGYFMKSPADLFECGVEIGPLGYAVGPNLDAWRADVMRKPHILLGPVDVSLEFRRVRGVVFKRASKSCQLDRRVFETAGALLRDRPWRG